MERMALRLGRGEVLAQAPHSILSPSQSSPPCEKGYSPIWDCATRVEVRSHSGEKGRPSSASLSPWGRRQVGKLERAPQTTRPWVKLGW